MKIGILTQPLHNNYGGLLQAFALQKVLIQLGHEVWTIDWQLKNKDPNLIIKTRSIIYRLIMRYVFGRNIIVKIWPDENELKKIENNTRRFIKENINLTQKFDSPLQSQHIKSYLFDVYIVGSDQVWRPKYSPNIFNFFLDFTEASKNIKRIAYAASFGVDHWEYTSDQTEICARLAKNFDAISVREDSALRLCNNNLHVEAIQVLDPTLLLSKEQYINLVDKDDIALSKGNLMLYFLDKSDEKSEIVSNVARRLNLTSFSVLPKNNFSDPDRSSIDDCIYPSVTEWLRGFMDAEFVITDSFHGTVFAIIFNKPFISIGNEDRGLTRFTSILEVFGLGSRLISSKNQLTNEILNQEIDWSHVNDIVKIKQKEALDFLDKYL